MTTDDAPKFRGQQDRDAVALAIGKIVLAWNDFHESLAEMYAEVCGRDKWAKSLTDWHSLRSDRLQRCKLLNAAQASLKDSPLLAEIRWIVETTNEVLAGVRNTGVHMPLMSFTDENGIHQMLPLTIFGNRFATGMVSRELLWEYAHFEQQIRMMFGYTVAINHNLRVGPEIRPARPDISNSGADTP